jgi:E3 ubiquitin-protein ligase HOS1
MPDETWRDIMEDFAATFSITRHSLLESLVFYLLDDHTDEALQVNFLRCLFGLDDRFDF